MWRGQLKQRRFDRLFWKGFLRRRLNGRLELTVGILVVVLTFLLSLRQTYCLSVFELRLFYLLGDFAFVEKVGLLIL